MLVVWEQVVLNLCVCVCYKCGFEVGDGTFVLNERGGLEGS